MPDPSVWVAEASVCRGERSGGGWGGGRGADIVRVAPPKALRPVSRSFWLAVQGGFAERRLKTLKLWLKFTFFRAPFRPPRLS